MLTSLLRTAFRAFWRHRGFSFLNVAGLAIGLAVSFLILLWIRKETAYDDFHDADVYRVMRTVYYGNGETPTWPAIPMPLAQEMREAYPEVEETALISWEQELVFNVDDIAARESGYHAGPAFFRILSFPLLQGDPAEVLETPDGMAVSRSLAEKYFDTPAEAVGRTIRIDNRRDFTVTGVFEDVPANSSMQFDFLLPIQDFNEQNGWVEDWGNNGLNLLVRLRAGTDPEAFNPKFENVINEHSAGARTVVFLQPWADQHLHSKFVDGELVGGRIEYVRTFGIVALFILLIASINFMNLATARSARRAREIGVRKAVGAGRASLAGQFLGESGVIVAVAFVLAVGLMLLTLPVFNDVTGLSATIGDLDLPMIGLFLAAGILTALLAGLYPALYLSSFNAARVLRGSVRSLRGASLRKGLVVFQFGMSILLIVGTLTVYKQIRYIQTKNLGLDRANLVYVPLEGGVQQQYDAFRQELSGRAGIRTVTRTSGNPLEIGQSTTGPDWDGKEPDAEILFHIMTGDVELLETMQMELVDGRDFDRQFGADTSNYIINERAAEAMAMDEPVGRRLTLWGGEGTIIGVVRDFHMSSLHSDIKPTIIRLQPDETYTLFVRMDDVRQGLANLGEVYARFNPTYPFDVKFLDATFEATYQSEMVVGRLANVFTGLAVAIACLGLFGLAAFTTEQRRKEIGIRKVLGAGVAGLVLLLSKDLVKLVLVAFVVAAPLAYLLMDDWLDQFAYRVSFGPVVLVAAGLGAVALAWLTVGVQSMRAAVADPVEALRAD